MHICAKINCRNRVSIGSENDIDNVSFVCLKCDRVYYNSPSAFVKTAKVARILFFAFIGILVILLILLNRKNFNQQHIKPEKSGDTIIKEKAKNDQAISESWISSKELILNNLEEKSKSEFQKNDLRTLKLYLNALKGTQILQQDTIFFASKFDSIITPNYYSK